jgi:Alg9-like mannosyltransferase family
LWFNAYCLVRTFSNSLEACLVVMALFHLWRDRLSCSRSPSDRRLAWALAALSVAVRPTASLVWLAVGVHFLFTVERPMRALFRDVLPVG